MKNLDRSFLRCNAGDTRCTQCSTWTKFAYFCALYTLSALYAHCGHPYILTSNQKVGSSNLPEGIIYSLIRYSR